MVELINSKCLLFDESRLFLTKKRRKSEIKQFLWQLFDFITRKVERGKLLSKGGRVVKYLLDG